MLTIGAALFYYKLGQTLLQNRAAITNWGKIYYKLGQVLQIRAVITNWAITFVYLYLKMYNFILPAAYGNTDK